MGRGSGSDGTRLPLAVCRNTQVQHLPMVFFLLRHLATTELTPSQLEKMGRLTGTPVIVERIEQLAWGDPDVGEDAEAERVIQAMGVLGAASRVLTERQYAELAADLNTQSASLRDVLERYARVTVDRNVP